MTEPQQLILIAEVERLLRTPPLPSVEALDAFVAFCAANEAGIAPAGGPPMSLFLGPATFDEHEHRLRRWLAESDASVASAVAKAKAELDAEKRQQWRVTLLVELLVAVTGALQETVNGAELTDRLQAMLDGDIVMWSEVVVAHHELMAALSELLIRDRDEDQGQIGRSSLAATFAENLDFLDAHTSEFESLHRTLFSLSLSPSPLPPL